MKSGVIYFDDKPLVVGEIPELHITPNEEDKKGPVPYFYPDSHECSLTVKLSYTKIRKICLSLIYGKQITNNWLKMHGGVMSRKVARRKRRLL